MKIGRNAPCPCGSGKKFKKCCLRERTGPGLPPETLREVGKRLRELRDREAIRRATFGSARPVVSALLNGVRFVAVRSRLYWSPKWKTFPDFLTEYMASVFPPAWANTQLALPLEQRHQVMQWYDHLCRFQRGGQVEGDGLRSAVPDGLAAAYWLLSYDLDLVANNVGLPARLVERLMSRSEFQAARYEVFAAATMVRADFDVRFEDEGDPARTHPEFVATHRPTGIVVAVEAKSRHRRGVLGFPGQRESEGELRSGVWSAIKKALEKSLPDPLLLFVDVNLPPNFGSVAAQPWIKDIEREFARTYLEHSQGAEVFGACFTNTPHHYGEPGAPDPQRRHYVFQPSSPQSGDAERQAFNAIVQALLQYGNIPNFFDDAQ